MSCMGDTLESLLESSPYGILLVDRNSHIVDANDNFAAIFETDRSKVIGRPLKSLLADLLLDITWKPLLALNCDYFSIKDTTTLTLTSGVEKTISFAIHPIYCDRANDNVLMFTIEDITEQTLLITSLKKVLSIYKTALTTMNTVVTIIGADGRILLCNSLPDSFEGKDYVSTLYNGKKFDNNGNYISEIIKVLETDEEIIDKIYSFGGAKKRVNIRRFHDSNNEFLGVIACYEDVSDDRFATSLSDDIFGCFSEIASVTVHEIKNPLTAMRALAQMGTLLTDSEKKNDSFLRIIKEIDNLNFFLSGISSVCAGNEDFDLQDPNDLIKEVIDLIQGELQLKNIDLEIYLSPESYKVQLYPQLFRQALINILKNAIQASTENGKIIVTSWQEDEKFYIKITDHGKGIPRHLLPHVGTPFFTTKETGTGLGLAITKKIIKDKHNGNLYLESEINKGTSLVIEIPL